MPVQVKICGLKTIEAVSAAVTAGAAFLGFVFYIKSPRNITAKNAAQLCAGVPAQVKKVAVTVDADMVLLDEIIRVMRPDYIQLHGKESPQRLRDIKKQYAKIKIIKALPVSKTEDLLAADAYANCADMLLFDSSTAGSGHPFDWNLLKDFYSPLPWFLSGGLTPENVASAIAQTHAAYVDVSSGVESSLGVKDTALIQQFIETARLS